MTDFYKDRTIKRFRVAREGQLVDGRVLDADHIVEMARTYDLTEYVARINCDHVDGYGTDSRFPAFGDVIAVDAVEEEFTIAGVTKKLMCLYNTVAALPNMLASAEAGQKLFPSIEYYPKFADTGMAYQVGLAMTNTPASRGTEPFKFSAQKDTLSTQPEQDIFIMSQDLKTQAEQTNTTDDNATDADVNQSTQTETAPETQQNKGDSFITKLKAMFAGKDAVGLTTEQEQVLLAGFESIQGSMDKLTQENKGLVQQLSDLKGELDALKQKLETTPATEKTLLSAGGDGYEQCTY